jgi:hypothetical protein
MPIPRDDDLDDDLDAPLGSDLDDESDDDVTDTRPCPQCQREVYAAADRCPYCGAYMVQELSGAASRGLLFVLTAIVVIGIVLWWAVARASHS